MLQLIFYPIHCTCGISEQCVSLQGFHSIQDWHSCCIKCSMKREEKFLESRSQWVCPIKQLCKEVGFLLSQNRIKLKHVDNNLFPQCNSSTIEHKQKFTRIIFTIVKSPLWITMGSIENPTESETTWPPINILFRTEHLLERISRLLCL